MTNLFIPHSDDAEQAVLGGLLIDNDSFDRVGSLKADHFYRADHRAIFTEARKFIEAGQSVDIITLDDKLQPSGVTDLSYLHSLTANTPSAANIARYADIVRSYAQRREMILLAKSMQDEASQPGAVDTTKLLDKAQSGLERIAESRVKSEPVRVSDDLPMYLQELESRAEGKTTKAIPTGYPDLDKRLKGGIRPGELIIVAGRPKMGKAQPLWSKVLLKTGEWKAIGGLSIGDRLAAVDSEESIVTGIFPQGGKDVYKVTMSDGRYTHCCAEHLWKVGNRKWAADRVMSLAEIAAAIKKPSMQGRIYIPLMSGDFGGNVDLPLPPYALGALLGNGDFSASGSIRFSTADQDTLDHLLDSLPGIGISRCDEYTYRLVNKQGKSNWVKDAIRSMGLLGTLSGQKFIPEQYMLASRGDRLALLQGMMDTDGWVEKKGCALYSTVSIRLADDIRKLARSLGFVVKLSLPRQKSYTHNGESLRGQPAYTLSISGVDRKSLFRLDRKQERCGDRTPRLNIESIELVSADECVCISVSHPDHLYITDDYIVTHNTAFSFNVGMNAAIAGYSVGELSMEMPRTQLHDRNTASVGKVDLDKLLEPQHMTADDWPRVTHAIKTMEKLNLFIDDQGGLTLMDVRMKAKMIKRRQGLDLLIIDYLQLMTGEGANRNAEIEGITRGLKALAKELECGIILLSQLNRQLEQRPNKRPMPSDLRDSGAIEQDCDVALFLYRDEVYNPDSMDKGICEVIVGLIRQGEPGTVGLTYIGKQTRFESLPTGYVFGYRPEQAKKKFTRGFE